ncbi:MAG: UDP-N-acetylglucosamine pyrophosphorylase [Oscillospiraceae bacterium]|nr:UDP-N-acetylglucosamine pyrophosphorylase [Oscillospiraceae bacterium]
MEVIMMIKIEELYDLNHTLAENYLKKFTYPWEALSQIRELVYALGDTLSEDYVQKQEGVWIHKTAQIAPTASITPPCIIGARAEVRHGAYIRGCALIGDDCVVGNSVELKNAILFDGVQVPHFNYVGDSILGYKAHMGAGAVTSNVKADRSPVVIHAEREMQTHRKKVGAMLGDYAEVGCNCVLNPGTVIGRNTNIYPLSNVRGVVPANSIYKNASSIVVKKEII